MKIRADAKLVNKNKGEGYLVFTTNMFGFHEFVEIIVQKRNHWEDATDSKLYDAMPKFYTAKHGSKFFIAS